MNEKLYLNTLKKYQKWVKENKEQIECEKPKQNVMLVKNSLNWQNQMSLKK